MPLRFWSLVQLKTTRYGVCFPVPGVMMSAVTLCTGCGSFSKDGHRSARGSLGGCAGQLADAQQPAFAFDGPSPQRRHCPGHARCRVPSRRSGSARSTTAAHSPSWSCQPVRLKDVVAQKGAGPSNLFSTPLTCHPEVEYPPLRGE